MDIDSLMFDLHNIINKDPGRPLYNREIEVLKNIEILLYNLKNNKS